MTKYLKNYISEIEKNLKDNKTNFKELERTHLIKIRFFQEERKIHLFVTLFYALFLILFLFLTSINPLYIFIVLILIVFLIFYVKHYLFLENNVQYLYKIYDEILKKIK